MNTHLTSDQAAAPDGGGPASYQPLDIPREMGICPNHHSLDRIRQSVIGDDQLVDGPYGAKRVTYADYTASGARHRIHRGFHPQ